MKQVPQLLDGVVSALSPEELEFIEESMDDGEGNTDRNSFEALAYALASFDTVTKGDNQPLKAVHLAVRDSPCPCLCPCPSPSRLRRH